MLYGRVLERVDMSVAELRDIVARLGARPADRDRSSCAVREPARRTRAVGHRDDGSACDTQH
jgi:hypothetical protein